MRMTWALLIFLTLALLSPFTFGVRCKRVVGFPARVFIRACHRGHAA
jgi:hypothetical protein